MRQHSMNGYSKSWHMKRIMQELVRRGTGAVTALGLLLIGSLIAGCGSGSGGGGPGVSPTSVSGVAATGAPLAGQVILRDSSSARTEKSTVTSSDGSFAIDVSGLSAPFILKATGTSDGVSRTMYSFAEKPGTANINPLSTAAVANAGGVDDPATLFDSPDAATLEKIRTGMPGSVSTLKAKLKVLFDKFNVADADPVKDPFTADHTGLDGMLDNVKITIVGGTLTMTNATTGVVIFTAPVRDIASGRTVDQDDDLPKPGSRPAAPTGVKAVGGDAQVTVSWDPVANATSYDLFYATQAKVAEEDDRDDEHAKRIKNVTSPFVVKGLAASTTYAFIVRAVNHGRRGPASAEVSATTSAATPAPTIPAAPTGVTATGDVKRVTLDWNAVTGATAYNLYWSTTTGVTTTTGTKISGIVNPPTNHSGLTEGATYFYVVTATNSAGESAASAQVEATVLAPTPTTTTTTTTTGATTSTTAGATTSTTAGGSTTTTAATTSTTAAATTTTTATPTTTTTASTTTTTVAALDGVALYNANCSGCHGANGKRPRTATQISNAIANNAGGMGFLSTLTQAQIAAIAARP